MRGRLDVREIEDIGDTALSYLLIWTASACPPRPVSRWCSAAPRASRRVGRVVYAVVKSRSADATVRHRLVDGQGQVVTVVSGFLNHLTDGEYSPNTIRAYAYDLRHFFNFLESLDLHWNTFRAKHGIEFLGYLRHVPVKARGVKRAGLTAVTADGSGHPAVKLSLDSVARALASVSSFYEYVIAVERYTDAEHPLQKVPDIASLHVSDRRRPMLGNASRQRPLRRSVRVRRVERLPRPADRAKHIDPLLNCLKTRRDRAIYLLMVNGGLRPAEVLCLQLDDIAYGRRRVFVRNRAEDAHPKGARGKSRQDRVVDLHDGLTLAAISEYVMSERPTDTGSRWVFLVGGGGTRRAEPLGYDAVVRGFSRRCEQLGIREPWLTPHVLRHSHATEMWDAGMREMTLQKRLGHRSPDSTRIYTRVTDEQVVKDYQAALQTQTDPDSRWAQ
jgi:integrase/recombinase XerD